MEKIKKNIFKSNQVLSKSVIFKANKIEILFLEGFSKIKKRSFCIKTDKETTTVTNLLESEGKVVAVKETNLIYIYFFFFLLTFQHDIFVCHFSWFNDLLNTRLYDGSTRVTFPMFFQHNYKHRSDKTEVQIL